MVDGLRLMATADINEFTVALFMVPYNARPWFNDKAIYVQIHNRNAMYPLTASSAASDYVACKFRTWIQEGLDAVIKELTPELIEEIARHWGK